MLDAREVFTLPSKDEGQTVSTDLVPLTKAIRRLTIAVWVIGGSLVAVFTLPWLGFIAFSRGGTESRVVEMPSLPIPPPVVDFDNDFHTLPVEDKIERASVILLTERRDQGDRHVHVVAEIVKRAPDIRLYYEVGEEFEALSHAMRPECDAECEGDGQVVFMTGNPASMRYSSSVRGERLSGFGDMPVAEFRRLARQAQPSPQ